MDIVSLAPILLLGVAFYFLLIRPQRNRQKKHAEMVSAVAPGSEVMTKGWCERYYRYVPAHS